MCEEDFVVPDIKPDIIAIKSTNANTYIYKEELSRGRLRLDGNIDGYVLYLSESGETRSLEITLDFNEFVEDECLEDEEEYQTFAGRDGILRQYGYAYGIDGKIYEKVSAHFDSFYFKGIERYKNVIKSPQCVYAFISSDGNFYYLTDTRCPFEPNDVVYVMDCHS